MERGVDMDISLNTIAGLVLVAGLLGACQTTPAGLPANPSEHIYAGDRVRVSRALTVPADKASVILQYGQVTSGSSIDRFDASCRFVMREIKTTPQKVLPGEFIVTKVSYWEDFIAPDYRMPLSGYDFITYEVTLRLHAENQPDVYSLVCKHEDEHNEGRYLRLSEMQQALGDYARIIQAGGN
jgi:hypothetical protein